MMHDIFYARRIFLRRLVLARRTSRCIFYKIIREKLPAIFLRLTKNFIDKRRRKDGHATSCERIRALITFLWIFSVIIN